MILEDTIVLSIKHFLIRHLGLIIEDVFITGFVADRCLVPKKHVDALRLQINNDTFAADDEKPDNGGGNVDSNQDILFVKLDHDLKHDLHKVMTRQDMKLGAKIT